MFSNSTTPEKNPLKTYSYGNEEGTEDEFLRSPHKLNDQVIINPTPAKKNLIFNSTSNDNANVATVSSSSQLPAIISSSSDTNSLKVVLYGNAVSNKKHLFTTQQENSVEFDRSIFIYEINGIQYSFREYQKEVGKILLQEFHQPTDQTQFNATGLRFSLSQDIRKKIPSLLKVFDNKKEELDLSAGSMPELQDQWLASLSELVSPLFKSMISGLHPYMHTDNGVATQAALYYAEALAHYKEKVFFGTLKSERGGADNSFPPVCIYHVDNDGIAIIDRIELGACSFRYPVTNYYNHELAGPDLYAQPSATAICHSRYMTPEALMINAYDIRRRLLSGILGVTNIDEENVEDEEFSREKIAIALVQSLAKSASPVQSLVSTRSLSIHDVEQIKEEEVGNNDTMSVYSVPLDNRSATINSENSHQPTKQAKNFSTKSFLTFQEDDFSVFENPASWDEHLLSSVAIFEDAPQDVDAAVWQHQQQFSQDAIYLEFPAQISQHLDVVKKEARASDFIERAVLTYIKASLQKNDLWEKRENRLGVCMTLLRYLENPPPCSEASTTAEEDIALVKDILKYVGLFEQNKFELIKITERIISQFKTHVEEMEAHYKKLPTIVPALNWENFKLILRKKEIDTKLQDKDYPELEDFISKYVEAISSGEAHSLEKFNELLKQNKKKFSFVINQILSSLIEFGRACAKIYRQDFWQIPEDKYFDPEENHLFYTRFSAVIYPLLETIEKYLDQLELFRDFSLLKTYCNELFPNNKHLAEEIQTRINTLEKPIDISRFNMRPFLKQEYTKIKEFLTDTQNLSFLQQKELCIYLYKALQKPHSFTLQDLLKYLYGTLEKFSGNFIDNVDHAFYSASVLTDAATYLHGYMSHYLNYTESNKNPEKYKPNVLIWHFYISLLSDYWREKKLQNSEIERNFLYTAFNGDAVQRVKSSVNANCTQRNAQSYIFAIDNALVELSFDESDRDVISACAWLAALVNRHVFSNKQIFHIYGKINQALRAINLEQVTSLWKAYRELEETAAKAEKKCLQHLLSSSSQLEPETSSYQSNLINVNNIAVPEEDGTLSIMAFHNKGKAVCSKGEQETIKCTLWRMIAERLVYATKHCISDPVVRCPSRRLAETSCGELESTRQSSDMREQIKGELFGIYSVGILLHLSETGPRVDLAVKWLQCLQISEARRQALLMAIKKLLKDDAALKVDHAVRLIFFSDHQFELFVTDKFYEEIRTQFELKKRPLTIEDFLALLTDALTYVVKQVSANNDNASMKPHAIDRFYHFFLSYFMEPLLTSASAIMYDQIFKSGSVLSNDFKISWLNIFNQIDLVGRIVADTNRSLNAENIYRNFVDTWKIIIARIFNRKPSTSPSNKKPYDIVLAYDASASLNLTSAMIVSNLSWKDISAFQLTPEIAKTLCFVLAQIPDTGSSTVNLSNTIDLRPIYRDLDRKLAEFSTFITCETSAFYPVKEMLQFGDVLCIYVDDRYPNSVSRHFFSRCLDRITHDVQRIYQARLNIFCRALAYLSQSSISMQDRYILQYLCLSMPLDYPIVFVYEKNGKAHCIEIYQKNVEIARNDCLASDSYLLRKAACKIPVGRPATELTKIIEDNTASTMTSIKSHINFEFLKILMKSLHDAMVLMNRSRHAPVISITTGVFSSSIMYDDPAALSTCSEEEKLALYLLGDFYQVLAKQENESKGSAGRRLLNVSKFYRERSNMVALGTQGIVESGILRFGSTGVNDPVEEKVRVRNNAFLSQHPSLTQSACCLWSAGSGSPASSSGNNSVVLNTSSDSADTSSSYPIGLNLMSPSPNDV